MKCLAKIAVLIVVFFKFSSIEGLNFELVATGFDPTETVFLSKDGEYYTTSYSGDATLGPDSGLDDIQNAFLQMKLSFFETADSQEPLREYSFYEMGYFDEGFGPQDFIIKNSKKAISVIQNMNDEEDVRLRIWDIESGPSNYEEVILPNPSSHYTILQVSPNGSVLFSGKTEADGLEQIYLYDAETKQFEELMYDDKLVRVANHQKDYIQFSRENEVVILPFEPDDDSHSSLYSPILLDDGSTLFLKMRELAGQDRMISGGFKQPIVKRVVKDEKGDESVEEYTLDEVLNLEKGYKVENTNFMGHTYDGGIYIRLIDSNNEGVNAFIKPVF